jgi:nucleoside phosphorylase
VVVHHGTIASGNQVIKDAAVRDKLSAELGGVLCFKIEAAGPINSCPCLVVRGVYNYVGSHKNKRWQFYVAGTAAAYAKEILLVIPPADVVKSRTVEETIRNASG